MGEVTDATRAKSVSKIGDRAGAGAACLTVYAWEHPPQVGRRHELADKVVTIGRSPNSTIVIDSEMVSPSHARIERRGCGSVLSDCGSTNRTYLGDERAWIRQESSPRRADAARSWAPSLPIPNRSP